MIFNPTFLNKIVNVPIAKAANVVNVQERSFVVEISLLIYLTYD